MPRDDVGPLRRFLQGPDAAPTASGSAARAVDQRAVDRVVDLYARASLLALQDFDGTFDRGDRDRAREVGGRLLHHWVRLGLHELDWSGTDRSDAQRILSAAAEIAREPRGERYGTDPIFAATSRARSRHWFRDDVDDIRRQWKNEYGDDPGGPGDADDRLRESLARLATARVVRDLVGLGTTTGFSDDVRRSVGEIVDQGLRLGDRQRSHEQAATAAERAASRHREEEDRTYATVAGSVVAGGVGMAVPWPTVRDVTFVVAMGVLSTQLVLDRRSQRELTSANKQLATQQSGLAEQRGRIDRSVDAAAATPQNPPPDTPQGTTPTTTPTTTTSMSRRASRRGAGGTGQERSSRDGR